MSSIGTAWDLPLSLLLFLSAQSAVYSMNLELASVVSAGFLCHSHRECACMGWLYECMYYDNVCVRSCPRVHIYCETFLIRMLCHINVLNIAMRCTNVKTGGVHVVGEQMVLSQLSRL